MFNLQTIIYTEDLSILDWKQLDSSNSALACYKNSIPAEVDYTGLVNSGSYNIWWFFLGSGFEGNSLNQKLYKKHIVNKNIIEYNKPEVKKPDDSILDDVESAIQYGWTKDKHGSVYAEKSFTSNSGVKWLPIPGCPLKSFYTYHGPECIMYVELEDNKGHYKYVKTAAQLADYFDIVMPTKEEFIIGESVTS